MGKEEDIESLMSAMHENLDTTLRNVVLKLEELEEKCQALREDKNDLIETVKFMEEKLNALELEHRLIDVVVGNEKSSRVNKGRISKLNPRRSTRTRKKFHA